MDEKQRKFLMSLVWREDAGMVDGNGNQLTRRWHAQDPVIPSQSYKKVVFYKNGVADHVAVTHHVNPRDDGTYLFIGAFDPFPLDSWRTPFAEKDFRAANVTWVGEEVGMVYHTGNFEAYFKGVNKSLETPMVDDGLNCGLAAKAYLLVVTFSNWKASWFEIHDLDLVKPEDSHDWFADIVFSGPTLP